MTRRWMTGAIALLLCLPVARDVAARLAIGLTGPLSTLALPRTGTPKHEGSYNREGSNIDYIGLGSGQSVTLLDQRGAGVVHRFWMTFAPLFDIGLHRQLILRMYWDDESSPSVEVPVGDFFGVGFGEQHDYVSLPLSETSGGYNCYWPMPFHRSARWTLTNRSSRTALVWYNVEFTAHDRLPREVRHFHAQWRRENPTTPGKSFTILEAAGRGHYVGAAVFLQNRDPAGTPALTILEGDERIYVDGQTTPTVNGTGTEDYFGGGFYFLWGPYAAPYHGAPVVDRDLGRVSAYRWHIEDAIAFKRAIRVTLEHGPENDIAADYSSVAFFYQDEPHAAFPSLPDDPGGLLPLVVPTP